MSHAIDETKDINADHLNTSFENNGCNKNEKTEISIEKNGNDEDGQHIFIENDTSSKNKNPHEGDVKYSETSVKWKDLYPQVVASCTSLLFVIQPGINLAYSNNLLHHIPSLNKGQFSWMTSILALGTPIGALLIGLIMDRIGRKKACLMTCLPLLMSWVISTASDMNSVYLYYVSRMFAGIGAGMSTVGIVYVSEISHSSCKQFLLSLNSVFFSGGVLVSTTLTYLNWNVVNCTFIMLTVVNMALIMIFMPESPIWLLKFKSSEYTGEAKAAMKQIYPKNYQVYKAEWKRLKAMTSAADRGSAANQPASFVSSLRSDPAAYKPMAILIVLILLQQLSGAYPTISYALPILKKINAGAETINDTESLAVLGAIRFVSGLLTSVLSFHVGRKPLLITSCVGMTLSSALVMYTYDPEFAAPATDGHGGAASLLSHIPFSLCGVMLYVFASSLGVLVFPWTLVFELLSTSVRAVGGSLLVSYAYLLMFGTMKAFPYVLSAISLPNVFLIFGVISLLMAGYVYFVVPETQGRNFQEIENYFTRSNKKKIRP